MTVPRFPAELNLGQAVIAVHLRTSEIAGGP
jgi:hypothetical protein